MRNKLSKKDTSVLLLSSRPWNSGLAERLRSRLEVPVEVFSSPQELTSEVLEKLDPSWIFATHWSYIIPRSVWDRWPTVIFHMTDLPYGRGGSPLQNLIKRGHIDTMLTAIRCDDGLDTGDIYIKKHLALHGSAEEIFLRADTLIEKMIEYIVHNKPSPKPQRGEVTKFIRRTPEQSDLATCSEHSLASWYDHIRMLDAEGYPHAFLEVHGMRLEFRHICRRSDGLHADVIITPIAREKSTFKTNIS